MIPRRSIRAALGALSFLAGAVLEAAAVLTVLGGPTAGTPVLAVHGLAALLVAGGAALVVTARSHAGQAVGIGLLFLLLALLLPGIGVPAVAGLALILCRHAWKPAPRKVPLAEVDAAPAPAGACPVNAPLAGIRHTLPVGDLQKALLGMTGMAPRHSRPLLKSLRKHRDVRVGLYANGLLNDHLNLFEKRQAALQDHLEAHPDDPVALTALVETFAALIDNKLIPADEYGPTTSRALTTAAAALALDPDNVPVLTAKARFELLRGDFPAAYATIRRLYDLPACFEKARTLHAELLFEHAATRPVRKADGAPVTPKVPARVLN